MQYSEETLCEVYYKTNGYCGYCEKKLALRNYGKADERGAWEVDHSVPRSRGGTDYLRNLVPACIECNRDKGARTGKSYRTSWERSEQNGWVDWGAIILGGLVVAGIVYYLARPKEQYAFR